jgi:heat shock protein HslJ
MKSRLTLSSKHFLIQVILTGIISLLLLVSACKKDDDETRLTNFWQLKQIEKRDIQPPVFTDAPEELPINVLFDPFGQVTIDSWCNSGSAVYIERGASLEIDELTLTEINCPHNEPIDWEAVFLYNFGLTQYYLIKEDTLVILTEGEYNLHFNKLQ